MTSNDIDSEKKVFEEELKKLRREHSGTRFISEKEYLEYLELLEVMNKKFLTERSDKYIFQ